MDSQETQNKTQVTEKLKQAFSFPYPGFSDPIQWIDDVGLSRVKEYPDNYASIYKFGIVRDEFNKDLVRKKLWVSVGYGKKLAEGISYGSERQKISAPIDLDFPDEIYYDTQTGKFYRNNVEITPKEILITVEDAHTKPSRPIKGLYLRCRLFVWRKLLPFIIKVLDKFLIEILWIISGEKTKVKIVTRTVNNYLDRPEIETSSVKAEIKKPRTINFLGYEAKGWSVVFYCILHLCLFAIYVFEKLHINWIRTIFENNFLAVCYAIVSLAIIESGMPKVLNKAIHKITPKLYGAVSFKKLKI